MNLRCVELWQIGLFGSMFFIGHVTGSTLLSEYGDTIGRVPMIRLGQGLSFLSYAVITFITRDIRCVYCAMFIFGMLSCCRGNLSFIYGQEIVANDKQNIGGCIFNLFDATVLIYSSLFMMFISVDWFYLHTIFTLLSGASFLIFCFLPESPKYLVQAEEFERAFEAYNNIAIFNGTPEKQLSRSANHRFLEERSIDRRMLKSHMRKAKQAMVRKTTPGGLALAASIIDEDERENDNSSYRSESDQQPVWSSKRKDSASYLRSAERRLVSDNAIEFFEVQSDKNS